LLAKRGIPFFSGFNSAIVAALMTTPTDLDPREYVPTLGLLKKIDFFQGVSEDNLKSLLFSLQKVIFPKQAKVLFQGEISNRMFIIQEGGVTISTKNKGTRLVLAELKPPSYFGEISLLRPVSATATVTAGEEGATLLVLTHESMTQLAKELPEVKKRIQEVIEARLNSKKMAKEADESA
jgi:CRP-like cAMP-binding protein